MAPFGDHRHPACSWPPVPVSFLVPTEGPAPRGLGDRIGGRHGPLRQHANLICGQVSVRLMQGDRLAVSRSLAWPTMPITAPHKARSRRCGPETTARGARSVSGSTPTRTARSLVRRAALRSCALLHSTGAGRSAGSAAHGWLRAGLREIKTLRPVRRALLHQRRAGTVNSGPVCPRRPNRALLFARPAPVS
jgi:hypothetical protein